MHKFIQDIPNVGNPKGVSFNELEAPKIGRRAGIFAAVCALLVFSVNAWATVLYDGGALNFESSGQSMWDSGTAFRKSDSVFLGTQWTNKTANFGKILGSVVTRKNLLYDKQLKKWNKCNDDPACDPGPLPSKTKTVDRRTGAKLSVDSSGKVGLEFGYSIDSGSVDSTAQFSALADLPDTLVEKNNVINLNARSTLDRGTLVTQSPKVEAYISAIMQLSASVTAQACAPIIGCTSGGFAIPKVNMDQRILSVDVNSLKVLDGVLPGGEPFANVPIFNQSLALEGALSPEPPFAGFKLTGPGGITLASSIPPGASASFNLAKLKAQVPDIATSGSKSGTDTISSNGRDDFISVQLDLDGAATLFGHLPPLGVKVALIDTKAVKVEASLDLIDVNAGPVLGITQDFELKPTLMVNLAFNNPIQIAGMLGLQTSWTGRWADLPDFSLSETTTFTPTYWIDAMLTNNFGIDLGLVGTLDVLKLGVIASVLKVDVLNIGPISLNGLLGLGNQLFETNKFDIPVFGKKFGFGGFNRITGNPFTIGVRVPGSGGGTVPGPGGVTVPEPGTIGMLLIGLVAMGFRQRRYRFTGR